MALIGTLVRWYESHQIGPDIGHIPVSNLYEVFVLFAGSRRLFYLYFEQHYRTRALGAFVMLVVSAAVGFLLWYTLVREAHEIQPLVPALQSWWMKLHVPANFIGYGTLLAVGDGGAGLPAEDGPAPQPVDRPGGRCPPSLAVVPLLGFWAGRHSRGGAGRWPRRCAWWCRWSPSSRWPSPGAAVLNARTPDPTVMDDLMYKAIAVGFAFFTIATILGAFWAAEAWGGYWSWDPKETWALIVWLNYAAWLHMRLMKGLRGGVAAWWALFGLVVTTFAFLGVNMFLSGLHSYGEL